MSRLTTKQRKAARFRRAVVGATDGQESGEWLPAVEVYRRRLSWTRLHAQGWRGSRLHDALARGTSPDTQDNLSALAACMREVYA